MTFRRNAIAYLSTAVTFLSLDAVWLFTMADRLYRPALGNMMLERFAIGPALAFYAIYFAGIVVFVVAPALNRERWRSAFALGALLGLVAYATYDLTNQATLKGWPWQVTLVDLVWGSLLTATSATVAYGMTRKLVRD
ncbi:DUF2177 family protein [Variovorax sp. J22R24]|uniref:DUF2177 family protein n=1 Tax=Variovorax gracilis TaxID=3053502 RepID=UPI0025768DC4|nr:DUF2177 family protein [Variovorax sp. J22R24]MDM0106181.1 DUF2177 family protein [Variovorax sp. J22R24]